ncbi:response regulator [Photobacterium nomapromontoriensis]|uniref:response regulator n=1 Tax=Photobacterium nomapromontoriensis TaxID=2910237 RepID=UPI003D0EF068
MLHTKTVLVVDDSHIIQQTTKAVLLKAGFTSSQIYTASNAADGLLLCKANTIDILLLDFNLGNGQSGLQLLEQLHRLRLLDHHPLVLIITADDSLPIVMAFAEFEPDDYLIKPLRQDILQQRLRINFSQQELNNTVWQAYRTHTVTGAKHALQQASSEKSFRLAITHLCKRLARNDMSEAAISILTSVTQQHNYLPAKLLLAELLHRTGQNIPACKLINDMLKIHPRHIKVLDLAARTYFANQHFKQGYEAWVQAHQLSHYNFERVFGLLLIELALFSERGHIDKIVRDGSRLLPSSMWDNNDRRCLLAWGMLQQPNKSHYSLEKLWCGISQKQGIMTSERPFLQLLNAWQKIQQGHTLMAFKQLKNIHQNHETKYSYGFQFILFNIYQQLGMRTAMRQTLAKAALLCTQETYGSHRAIKYQWIKEYRYLLTEDTEYHNALRCYEHSPKQATSAILKAWQHNRFDIMLAYSLINLYCDNLIELNQATRETFIQARWVFESLPQRPAWYSQLQDTNSILQTPVQTMTTQAKGQITV